MIPDPTSASSKKSHNEAKSSGAVNPSGEESGNENHQKNERRRKRTHSLEEHVQRRSPRASCSRTRRGGGGGGGGGAGGGRRRKQKRVQAVTLFEVITMGKSAMRAVIDDWIEAYAADRDSSLLDLISFFIQCCGCNGVVTAEMCQSRDDSDVMSQMVEELDEVASLQYKKFLAFPWILTVTWPMDTEIVEYPLIESGPYGRWFHSEFSDFVSVLVSQCQHSILYDSYLMDALISLLTQLSDSFIRAFRHTCTLAAVKLMSSLVGVATNLSAGIENSQKLYKVQKTKSSRQKVTPQLERIQKKIKELKEKKVEIENMMDIVFKGVFLKRYRDVLPEIRSLCVEELGLWMKLYSSSFLNDTYLKYLGWMMYDKIPDVRLKCVMSLQALYGDPLLLPRLDLFTSRFKERLISMTLDKDNEVSLQTMKLLILISRTCEDVLDPDDYKQLLQFVYSSQRPLAAAAGELLYSRIVSAAAQTSDSQVEMNEEEEHQRQTSARLTALLRFHQESELHKHVVYLVDSLWDCGGALLRDWSTLTSILLQEPSSHSPGLTPAEEALLVEVLVASVRQASEGPALAGRSGAKKGMSAREKKTQMDECAKLTQHLLTVLPKLLKKFSSSSSDVVASLMRIPQFFLSEPPSADNTQALSSLLAEVGLVLDVHSGPSVLEAAARTFLSLCAEETSWSGAASDARDSLIQTWVNTLTVSLQEALKDDSFSADEEKTREVLSTLRKLRAFHNCHDLSRWSVFELLSPLLSVGGAPPEVVLEVLQCLCFSLIWSLNTSGAALTSRDKAVSQRLQLRVFCERSHHFISHSDTRVRHQAFLGVCDVLTAHSFQVQVWDPTSFGPLAYTPSPKLQRALSTFVCAHVFLGPDTDGRAEGSEVEKLDELHRRRNLLAAFCKLIVQGVLEMSTAAEVLMYYMKYYNDFGDIIKETLYRARQMDKIESSRTLVLCLQQLFTRLKKEQQSGGRAHPEVQTFTSIKELARRFALTFGDTLKFRECLVLIHRMGVEFVFQGFKPSPETPTPALLPYLTILSEFSSKLLRPDKKTVLSYLHKHTSEHLTDLRDEAWKPLVYYRASLLAAAEGEDAVSNVGSDRRPGPHNRSALNKHKLEGSKSPCPLSPLGSKVSKGHRSANFSPSLQEKPAELDQVSPPVDQVSPPVDQVSPPVDQVSPPVDPPARRTTEESDLEDDLNVEVEL